MFANLSVCLSVYINHLVSSSADLSHTLTAKMETQTAPQYVNVQDIIHTRFRIIGTFFSRVKCSGVEFLYYPRLLNNGLLLESPPGGAVGL